MRLPRPWTQSPSGTPRTPRRRRSSGCRRRPPRPLRGKAAPEAAPVADPEAGPEVNPEVERAVEAGTAAGVAATTADAAATVADAADQVVDQRFSLSQFSLIFNFQEKNYSKNFSFFCRFLIVKFFFLSKFRNF